MLANGVVGQQPDQSALHAAPHAGCPAADLGEPVGQVQRPGQPRVVRGRVGYASRPGPRDSRGQAGRRTAATACRSRWVGLRSVGPTWEGGLSIRVGAAWCAGGRGAGSCRPGTVGATAPAADTVPARPATARLQRAPRGPRGPGTSTTGSSRPSTAPACRMHRNHRRGVRTAARRSCVASQTHPLGVGQTPRQALRTAGHCPGDLRPGAVTRHHHSCHRRSGRWQGTTVPATRHNSHRPRRRTRSGLWLLVAHRLGDLGRVRGSEARRSGNRAPHR
ncbi:hypothetical protein B0I31_103767 [Saccharothrix carnea]|uniref:Uncharacterized protein n=1 Tax=Saccharothrix carnea TaxID=1280637 RepID=A0A2P8IEX4_SACCR|nr:hypothetical protein B0I31_103767 [Saccharothrix carnea]